MRASYAIVNNRRNRMGTVRTDVSAHKDSDQKCSKESKLKKSGKTTVK